MQTVCGHVVLEKAPATCPLRPSLNKDKKTRLIYLGDKRVPLARKLSTLLRCLDLSNAFTDHRMLALLQLLDQLRIAKFRVLPHLLGCI